MKIYPGFLLLLVLAGTCGCSGMKVEESTPQAVSIRYDGVIETLEDATEVARKDCARYGETAHLRKIDETTTFERYAHFDCVSR
jgi:citrate lyase beta subunit